jgi:hypothetical protein
MTLSKWSELTYLDDAARQRIGQQVGAFVNANLPAIRKQLLQGNRSSNCRCNRSGPSCRSCRTNPTESGCFTIAAVVTAITVTQYKH